MTFDILTSITLFVLGWNLTTLYQRHRENRRAVVIVGVCLLVYMVTVRLS